MNYTKFYALIALPLVVVSWLISYFSPAGSTTFLCAIATSVAAALGLMLMALLETKRK